MWQDIQLWNSEKNKISNNNLEFTNIQNKINLLNNDIFNLNKELNNINIDTNTEEGKKFFQGLPSLSYRVTENEKGKLRWTTVINNQETVETKEPQTSGWLRFKAWFLKIAPERQL